jgi:uncharacterized protein YecA (UPF0149 family)
MASPKVVFPLRLAPELKDFLQEKAQRSQLSLNSLIAMSLVKYWGYEAAKPVTRLPTHHEAADLMKGALRNNLCPCGSGRKVKHCCGRRVNA